MPKEFGIPPPVDIPRIDGKEEEDEIFDYGFRKLRAHYFGAHPFAIASIGRVNDLENLSFERWSQIAATFLKHLIRALATAIDLLPSLF